MNNNTKSKIIITMKNIDHAHKLMWALKTLQNISATGGDIGITIYNADGHSDIIIGHDVNIKNIHHLIFEE